MCGERWMCMNYPGRTEGGIGHWIPRAGATSACELSDTHGCCKLNLDPLKKCFSIFPALITCFYIIAYQHPDLLGLFKTNFGQYWSHLTKGKWACYFSAESNGLCECQCCPCFISANTRIATCDWPSCLDLSTMLLSGPWTAAIFPREDPHDSPNHVHTVSRESLSSKLHSVFSDILILY